VLRDSAVDDTVELEAGERDGLTDTWQLLDRAPRGRSGAPADWPLRGYECRERLTSGSSPAGST